jgi:hypothetical protein
MRTRETTGRLAGGLVAALLAGLLAGCGGDSDTAGGAGDGAGGAGDGAGGADVAVADDGAAPVDVVRPGADVGPPADLGGPRPDVGAPPDAGVRPDSGRPCGTADVRGRVCAPNEQVWVSGAQVWIDTIGCDGQPARITALSDASGYYLLEGVPAGPQTIHIERGSYRHEFEIAVAPGALNDLTGQDYKLCFTSRAARLAVITGDWDNIESLIDRLGLDADIYRLYGSMEDDWASGQAVRLLSDLNAMKQYDILLVDCGAHHDSLAAGTPIVDQNIRRFVEDGGSLYLSDFAYIYGERVWPGAIDYYGDNETASWNSPDQSQGPIVLNSAHLTGVVWDADLKAYLGNPASIPVDLGLSPLVSAVGGAATTQMHVVAMIPQFETNQPLILSYRPTPTSGRVIYTTFHNTEQDMEQMQKVLQYLMFFL